MRPVRRDVRVAAPELPTPLLGTARAPSSSASSCSGYEESVRRSPLASVHEDGGGGCTDPLDVLRMRVNSVEASCKGIQSAQAQLTIKATASSSALLERAQNLESLLGEVQNSAAEVRAFRQDFSRQMQDHTVKVEECTAQTEEMRQLFTDAENRHDIVRCKHDDLERLLSETLQGHRADIAGDLDVHQAKSDALKLEFELQQTRTSSEMAVLTTRVGKMEERLQQGIFDSSKPLDPSLDTLLQRLELAEQIVETVRTGAETDMLINRIDKVEEKLQQVRDSAMTQDTSLVTLLQRLELFEQDMEKVKTGADTDALINRIDKAEEKLQQASLDTLLQRLELVEQSVRLIRADREVDDILAGMNSLERNKTTTQASTATPSTATPTTETTAHLESNSLKAVVDLENGLNKMTTELTRRLDLVEGNMTSLQATIAEKTQGSDNLANTVPPDLTSELADMKIALAETCNGMARLAHDLARIQEEHTDAISNVGDLTEFVAKAAASSIKNAEQRFDKEITRRATELDRKFAADRAEMQEKNKFALAAAVSEATETKGVTQVSAEDSPNQMASGMEIMSRMESKLRTEVMSRVESNSTLLRDELHSKVIAAERRIELVERSFKKEVTQLSNEFTRCVKCITVAADDGKSKRLQVTQSETAAKLDDSIGGSSVDSSTGTSARDSTHVKNASVSSTKPPAPLNSQAAIEGALPSDLKKRLEVLVGSVHHVLNDMQDDIRHQCMDGKSRRNFTPTMRSLSPGVRAVASQAAASATSQVLYKSVGRQQPPGQSPRSCSTGRRQTSAKNSTSSVVDQSPLETIPSTPDDVELGNSISSSHFETEGIDASVTGRGDVQGKTAAQSSTIQSSRVPAANLLAQHLVVPRSLTTSHPYAASRRSNLSGVATPDNSIQLVTEGIDAPLMEDKASSGSFSSTKGEPRRAGPSSESRSFSTSRPQSGPSSRLSDLSGAPTPQVQLPNSGGSIQLAPAAKTRFGLAGSSANAPPALVSSLGKQPQLIQYSNVEQRSIKPATTPTMEQRQPPSMRVASSSLENPHMVRRVVGLQQAAPRVTK